MSVKEIIEYLEANRGKYPLELLISELRKAGHSENEIQQALSIPQGTGGIPTGGKVGKAIGGFLAGLGIILGGDFLLSTVLISSFSLLAFSNSFLFGRQYIVLIIGSLPIAIIAYLYFTRRFRSPYFYDGMAVPAAIQLLFNLYRLLLYLTYSY